MPLLILTLIIGGATVAVALAIDWIPVQAAEQAERTDTLLWFVVWASVVIFTLVTVVIVYCAWRFRAKPGDDSDGPDPRQHEARDRLDDRAGGPAGGDGRLGLPGARRQ